MKSTRTRPAQHLDLTDRFLPTAPANDFLNRLNALVDWEPIRTALEAMFTATTGRLPQPPLCVFKMLLLQHCYNLSDPQCEALVADRLSWRKFVGLALRERVLDETTLVRFRQRLIHHGLHEQLLALINEQLAAQGLILHEVTLVDATLVQAARRAPTIRASAPTRLPLGPPVTPQCRKSPFTQHRPYGIAKINRCSAV